MVLENTRRRYETTFFSHDVSFSRKMKFENLSNILVESVVDRKRSDRYWIIEKNVILYELTEEEFVHKIFLCWEKQAWKSIKYVHRPIYFTYNETSNEQILFYTFDLLSHIEQPPTLFSRSQLVISQVHLLCKWNSTAHLENYPDGNTIEKSIVLLAV